VTLLYDLDNTAAYHEARAYEDPEHAESHRNLAARLRAHAERLRTFADHVVVTWVAGEAAYTRP